MRDLENLFENQTKFPQVQTAKVGKILKIFNKNSTNAGKYKWKFPFIDVFFYSETKSHIQRHFHDKLISTLKKHVFPLKLRPFGSYWLPTPRDPIKYLEQLNYTGFHQSCVRSTWNHRLEKGQAQFTIRCSELQKIYSMVERDCLRVKDQEEEFCTENLIFNNQTLVILINYSGNYLFMNLEI